MEENDAGCDDSVYNPHILDSEAVELLHFQTSLGYMYDQQNCFIFQASLGYMYDPEEEGLFQKTAQKNVFTLS